MNKDAKRRSSELITSTAVGGDWGDARGSDADGQARGRVGSSSGSSQLWYPSYGTSTICRKKIVFVGGGGGSSSARVRFKSGPRLEGITCRGQEKRMVTQLTMDL